MMKPLTLLILVGAFTAPLYGAEAVSAAVSSDAPAASASAPTASSAAVATAPVSAATPAPSEAVPVLLPAEPVTPVASSGEGAAPLPKPAEPAAVVAPPAPLAAGELQAVPLYRQDELLNWIEQGHHLTQVKQDRCQLTQDIEARASVMKIPAYQFLWGDMLAWGVCTKSNA
ncbi:MAG: sel1 repeat family protein, partial [Aeromonas veronii]